MISKMMMPALVVLMPCVGALELNSFASSYDFEGSYDFADSYDYGHSSIQVRVARFCPLVGDHGRCVCPAKGVQPRQILTACASVADCRFISFP